MITERERQILRWIEDNPLISQQELAARAGIARSSVAVHISNLMKKGFIQGKGYLLQKNPYIVVVGGANMDISGRPDAPLVAQDSNPGKVRLSPGGVARNIAHNLALLGEDVKLITAFGDDPHANQLAEGCRRLGIDVNDTLTVPGGTTSTYLFIADHTGEMQLAINEMDIYEELTPRFFESKMDLINRASLCVMDTNLPEESLRFLAENCRCPLFADTVSTVKAKKLAGLFYKIHTIKPNLLEAQLLTGIEIRDEDSLRRAARRFLDMGVEQVFLSLGSKGVFCADHHEQFHLPAYPSHMVNSTGAGDSFMAALAWGWRQGFSLRDCAKAGLAAADICIESAETISPRISAESILAITGAPTPTPDE